MDQQELSHLINSIIQHDNYSLKIESNLGDGGQGGVFKVIDRQQNQIYALKLQKDLSINEEIVLNKFIEHKDSLQYNIRIYDKFKYNQYQCILMEYAPNRNLYQSITEGHDVKEMLRQLALGLQELHHLKMVHRDIKPENIVIFGEQNPRTYKICDTGLIRLDGDPNFIDNMLRGSGSPFYQAPEMLTSYPYQQEEYSNKVDVFALGAVIYEVIMNQTLFDQNNQEDMEAERLGSLNNNAIIMDRIDQMTRTDQLLKQLLKSMLHPDHRQRFTLKQVLEAIESLKPKIIKIIPRPKPNIIIKQAPSTIQLPIKPQSPGSEIKTIPLKNLIPQQDYDQRKQQLESPLSTKRQIIADNQKLNQLNETLQLENIQLKQQAEDSMAQIKQLIAENEQLNKKIKAAEQPQFSTHQELEEIEELIKGFPTKLKETLKLIAQDQYLSQFKEKKHLLTSTTANGTEKNTHRITTPQEYLDQLLKKDWLKDQILSIDKLVLKFWEQISEVAKIVYKLKQFQTFELLENIKILDQIGNR